MEIIKGGVTAAKGFRAASTAAGIKYQGRTDMAMIYAENPCKAAGTFTTNVVKAAPVKWDQEIVYHHPAAQEKRGTDTAGRRQKPRRKFSMFRRTVFWWPPQA